MLRVVPAHALDRLGDRGLAAIASLVAVGARCSCARGDAAQHQDDSHGMNWRAHRMPPGDEADVTMVSPFAAGGKALNRGSRQAK